MSEFKFFLIYWFSIWLFLLEGDSLTCSLSSWDLVLAFKDINLVDNKEINDSYGMNESKLLSKIDEKISYGVQQQVKNALL